MFCCLVEDQQSPKFVLQELKVYEPQILAGFFAVLQWWYHTDGKQGKVLQAFSEEEKDVFRKLLRRRCGALAIQNFEFCITKIARITEQGDQGSPESIEELEGMSSRFEQYLLMAKTLQTWIESLKPILKQR